MVHSYCYYNGNCEDDDLVKAIISAFTNKMSKGCKVKDDNMKTVRKKKTNSFKVYVLITVEEHNVVQKDKAGVKQQLIKNQRLLTKTILFHL